MCISQAAKESFPDSKKSGWSAAEWKDKVDTVGSGQAFLSEEDSLWRENRQLRCEVQSWQEEAAARQRETTELRLEVAQLQAELHAERNTRQMLAQAEAQGGATSSSSVFRAAKEKMPCGLDSDWIRAKRLSSAAWMDSQRGVAQSADLAIMATRHAEEVVELQLQHSRALQEMQSQADVFLGRAKLAEDACTLLQRKQVRLASMLDSLFKVRQVAWPFFLWRKAVFRATCAQQSSSLVECAKWQALQRVQSFLSISEQTLLCFAFQLWLAEWHFEKGLKGSCQDFEVQLQELSAQLQRAEGAVTLGASLTAVRRILKPCFRAWERLLQQHRVEKILQCGRDQQAAWRLEFLDMMFLQSEEDNCAMLMILCWQAWSQAARLGARQKAYDAAKLELRKVQRRFQKFQIIAVGASAQVHLMFLLRASFVGWRQLQCLQLATLLREDSRNLHFSLAHLCHSRDFTVNSIARRANENAVFFCLALAWTIWKRSSLEAAMIQDFDAVRTLLLQLQGEWARQHDLQQQQDFGEQQAHGRLKLALALNTVQPRTGLTFLQGERFGGLTRDGLEEVIYTGQSERAWMLPAPQIRGMVV